MNKRFLLLQINDSVFPIGGYSHSQGLETYIQKELVTDAESAKKYVFQKIRWSLTYTELLAARLAYEYAGQGLPEKLSELEDLLEASRLPYEQREASRKMGSRFVKTVQQLDTGEIRKIYQDYIECRKGKCISHCCVYGVFCAALGIDLKDVLIHYLYAQTSAMITNCVKTIPIKQSEGQMLLSECYPVFQEVLQEVMTLKEEDLCLSAPGFDLRGIQHERLYSRLYMS